MCDISGTSRGQVDTCSLDRITANNAGILPRQRKRPRPIGYQLSTLQSNSPNSLLLSNSRLVHGRKSKAIRLLSVCLSVCSVFFLMLMRLRGGASLSQQRRSIFEHRLTPCCVVLVDTAVAPCPRRQGVPGTLPTYFSSHCMTADTLFL